MRMSTAIRIITGTAMTTDPAALLTLAQWLSPAYPVGAFSYSHGLEWAVQAGDVSDAASFQGWLSDVLEHGAGRNDAILLAAAFGEPAPEALQDLNDLAIAMSPSPERRLETVQQGQAFCRTTSAIWPAELDGLAYPVAVGAAARLAGLPLQETLLFYLHGFAGNLSSAALRLVPLGQTEGQAALAALAPLCEHLAAEAQTLSLDDLGGAAFLADIASMKHETQYARLFRS